MADVFDVANHVLEHTGYVSTMKLQKLVFYSQALSLVERGVPLFGDTFEAWANGPVCWRLFQAHRGKFIIGPGELAVPNATGDLDSASAAIVDRVVAVLRGFTGRELSDLTHSEALWRDARAGYADGQPSREPITNESILAFYGSPACMNPVFA